MSDPIADILKKYWPYTPHKKDVAKQIRQQIGRELLDPNKTTYGYTAEMIARIREVCKLEGKK